MTTISCSKDDDNTEDDYEKTENLSNQDPDGTIIINMISGSSDNYYKIGDLGQIHIDAANNFRGYSNNNNSYNSYKIEFVTIGKVDGLGQVNQIPMSGWGESAAVVPGTGYMMRYINNKEVQYARIYVVDYLSSATTDEFGNTTGSNSGAIIKYQAPFKGTDEEIDIEVNSITFDSKGGSQELVFNNKNIIQFTVKSSESWCTVQKSSSLNDAYFSNAITISASPSYLPEPRTATVTLTTIYEKEVVVTVTQSGVEPYISISDDMPEVTISAMEQQLTKAISTNYDISDIIVTSSNDWCKAELKSYSYTRAGNDNYSSKSYYLNLNIEGNESTENRTAKIILKSNDGRVSATLTIKQEGVYFKIEKTDFVIGAQGGELTIDFTSTVSGNSLSAESNAEWCRPSYLFEYDYSYEYTENGRLYYYNNRLHLNCDANPDLNDRSAEIKILNAKGATLAKLAIKQDKVSVYIPESAWFDRNSSGQAIDIWTTLTDISVLNPESSVDWCTLSTNGQQIVLRVTATTEDREGYISFKGISDKIKVVQSKYAVNDEYNENNIQGTVGYMNGATRYIFKEVGQTSWSFEEFLIGANNDNDGQYNMEIVKKIPNWQNFYSAFALCDALNTEGVTGWYLPSRNELYSIIKDFNYYDNYWSSTEYDKDHAYYCNKYDGVRYKEGKNREYKVIAIHKF